MSKVENEINFSEKSSLAIDRSSFISYPLQSDQLDGCLAKFTRSWMVKFMMWTSNLKFERQMLPRRQPRHWVKLDVHRQLSGAFIVRRLIIGIPRSGTRFRMIGCWINKATRLEQEFRQCLPDCSLSGRSLGSVGHLIDNPVDLIDILIDILIDSPIDILIGNPIDND